MTGNRRRFIRGSNRSYVLLTIAIWAVLYLPNLWWRDLTGTDEPKYAQVAREVLLDGHWFALHHNGDPYYGEPPLYFWLEALLSLPYGDVTPFIAMLTACLFGLGTMLLTYSLGKRLFDADTGFLGAAILATLPQFHNFSCTARLNVPFTFFITAALTAFYFGYSEVNVGAPRRVAPTSYFSWGWVLLGLAAITEKGPIAFILVGATVLVFLWRRGELRLFLETRPVLGLFLSAVPVTLWLLPAYLTVGRSYMEGLFGQFNSQVTTPLGVDKFLFYFSAIFVDGSPWSILLPFAFYAYWKERGAGVPQRDFLWTWLFVILITFSIILQKFSRYILPLYPAVALILAHFCGGYIRRPALREWTSIKGALCWGLAPFLGLLFAWIFFGLHTHKLVLSYLIIGAMGVGLLGLSFVVRQIFRDKQWEVLFVFTFLVTSSFQMSYNRFLFPWEKENRSERAYCEELKGLMEPGAPWAVYRIFRPAQVYYTKSHPKAISSEEELVSFWAGGPPEADATVSLPGKVYCLMAEADYNGLTSTGRVPLFKVAELQGLHKARLVLVSNLP